MRRAKKTIRQLPSRAIRRLPRAIGVPWLSATAEERLVMEDMRSVEVPPVPPRRLLAHHPRRGRAGRLALLRE